MDGGSLMASGRIAKELAREFRKGYSLERLPRNGHFIIRDPDGEVVRSPRGDPYHIPFSPRGRSAPKQLRRDLKALGVIASG